MMATTIISSIRVKPCDVLCMKFPWVDFAVGYSVSNNRAKGADKLQWRVTLRDGSHSLACAWGQMVGTTEQAVVWVSAEAHRP